MAKSIMIQGTMSNAGKSFLVAGICRILKQDGYRVAPFKSQNMALNSYITEDGLEMGRAQVMQAEACGVEPTVYMNPILLKPTTDVGSQVIVNGIPRGNMRASDYFKYKTQLIPDILNAWRKLSEEYDVIVIEGAGSPAEINLKKNDIVNMGLAELVDAPVLLVGDIDRGGVFAQLAGTLALLEEPERQRIRGFIMNKFRGDVEILRPGLDMLWERCHVETIGVIPYAYLDLDDEDSLSERLSGERQEKDIQSDESKKKPEEKLSEHPGKNGEERLSEHPGKNDEERLSEHSGKNDEEKFSEHPKTDGDKKLSNDSKNNICRQNIKSEVNNIDDTEKAGKVSGNQAGLLKIAVIRLPRISNFTDFNVLQAMDGVKVSYVTKVSELGEPHMVILPGTKSTIADMRWLRESGLETAILKLHNRGVTIFGICGGFQMLGEKISDPLGVESEKHAAASIAGMGILPLETVFQGEKVRSRMSGTSGRFTGDYAEASEKQVSGYEIHMGHSVVVESRKVDGNRSESNAAIKEVDGSRSESNAAIKEVDGNRSESNAAIKEVDGSRSESNAVIKKESQAHENAETGFDENGLKDAGLIYQKENVFGTYVHGIFDEQEFRESFLSVVAKRNNINLAAQTVTDYHAYKESQYDKLADVVRSGMDMKKFYEILGIYPEKYFPGGKDEEVFGKKDGEISREKDVVISGEKNREIFGEKDGEFFEEKDGIISEERDSLKGNDKRGLIHLYYGDGKGKTTAAVGLAVRAAGAGKKAVFCQFLKSGESGELTVLECTPGIRILRSEEKFGFSWTLSEEERARLREIHINIFREAMQLVESGHCDVLILDEICDALEKNLMDANLFSHFFETAGAGGCEWVLTGRNPDERLLKAADYVTYMRKDRHPFDEGVKARRGIEF